MKYRVPRCLYSRAEGWSWIALVRSFTASLIRPSGDRIYKPKNVIRGEKSQWLPLQLPTLLTFQVCFTTPHLQCNCLSSLEPLTPRTVQWDSKSTAEGLPTLSSQGDAEELRSWQLPCPCFMFCLITDVAFLEVQPFFPNLSFTFQNKIWHVKLIWNLTLNH